MVQAKHGDKVQVHYTGRLDDGTVFDSSRKGVPLEFTLGTGQIIPGLELAIVGMKVGDVKTERIPFHQAYGPHRDEMVLVVDRGEIPENIPLDVGARLHIRHPEGYEFDALIREFNDQQVMLDANHPLAGQDLIFEIELVRIGSQLVMP